MSTYERTVPFVTPRAASGARSSARATSADPGRPGGHAHLAGLDGLRALAIGAVVLFHLDPTWLPGGFLGVDVFFVVSGFLITTLLVREAEQSTSHGPARIRLRRFATHRARRLLPALFACLTVSIVVARVVHPDLLVNVGREVVGALTFTTNWVEITAGSSYFDQTAPQLFMNLWSLAVEEQFYLVWPLAVLGLVIAVRRPSTRAAVALGLGFASTALMALLVSRLGPGGDATRVYYGTDTHLVGLMLGAALAFTYAAPGHGALGTDRWCSLRRPLLVGAAAGLGALLWWGGEDSPLTFRGGIALGSLATTVLLAGLLPTEAVGDVGRASRWRLLMDSPALRWVGRRSYGIYLWHWPVIVITGLDQPTAPGTSAHLLAKAWAVLVTLALADLSYRFLEAPVRLWGFRGVALIVVRGLFSPFTRVPRVVVGTSAVVLALAVGVVLTAPDRTETQRMLEANQQAAESAPGIPAAPGLTVPSILGAAGAGGPTTPATPAPSASAGTPAAPDPSGTAPAATPTAGAPSRAELAAYTMPSGQEMDIFGDSIVVASINALQYYFPGIRSDARSNRQWSDGLTQVTAHAGDLRRAVVVDFGTNAGVDEAAAKRVLDLIGTKRMVVLVTIYGRASWIDAANASLSRIATGRDNVVVADWHSAISAHPELLQSDGIHPSITGAHLFAKTIRAALAQLSERHTGVKVTLKELPSW
ncbi:acyltransferase family protein [Dermatophilaceae bacterium Soc4.6]